MKDGRGLSGDGLPFPRWIKVLGALMGLFLLGDGLRRFLTVGGGVSAFLPHILIGSACIYVAGYDKKITLGEGGFTRRSLFWGRGKIQSLPWEDMEEIIILPGGKGTGAIFPIGDRGWRAFFPSATEDDLRAVVAKYRPGLPVRKSRGGF